MKDLLTDFAYSAFAQIDLHRVANQSYKALFNGDEKALETLSRYLACRGFIVVTRGYTLSARASASRAEFPETLVFTLNSQNRIGGIARAVHVSTWCLGYYVDETGMREIKEHDDAELARASEAASDRCL